MLGIRIVSRYLFPLALLFFTTSVALAVEKNSNNFQAIEGEWVRSDGGYTLQVPAISADGSTQVKYFNPKPINVAESSVSHWKGLVKLYVKLQGKGYPGSTYTLYYYEEKDALAGFYYQAVQDQTYEVVFFRKPEQ